MPSLDIRPFLKRTEDDVEKSAGTPVRVIGGSSSDMSGRGEEGLQNDKRDCTCANIG